MRHMRTIIFCLRDCIDEGGRGLPEVTGRWCLPRPSTSGDWNFSLNDTRQRNYGLRGGTERRSALPLGAGGSTGIAAQLDAEEWRDLVNAYLDNASAAVTEMGGHVAKKLGDGLMALFGYPTRSQNITVR